MKCAVIGLGSFGFQVAKTLHQNGHEVLVIDRDRARVDEAREFAAAPVVMEAGDKEGLRALGLEDVDVAVVSLGHGLESSILTVLYLKELGVKRIVAKAMSEDHAKILSLVGASEVVYPERDMAVKTALRLSYPDVIEFLPLAPGVLIEEVQAPEAFVGRTLKELDLRNRHEIHILAIRDAGEEKAVHVPRSDHVVRAGEILILMGGEKELRKLNEA